MKNKFYQLHALLALFLLIPFMGYAQQVNITGTVIDDTNETLPGVNVVIKGSAKGTITDVNGKYGLSAPQGATLVFTYIGCDPKEVKVGSSRVINVTLKSSAMGLDEVVVTGYGGEVRRRDLTGSIAKANVGDLTKAPVANFDQALAGRVAGVVVTSNEGTPGGEMNIVIRGNNSLTQNNSPLYVVDGFPFENFNSGSLNSNDIESVDVLKDASATAIYGSRGANGVIIITTKKGQVGATRVNYEGYVGFSEISKRTDLLSPYEFVKLQEEIRAPNQPNSMANTYYSPLKDAAGNIIAERDAEYYRNPPQSYNWEDHIYRSALMHNHSLNFSGGTPQSHFNATISYLNQEGVLIKSDYERFNGKINLDNKFFNDKVRVILNATYSDNTYIGSSPSSASDIWTASSSLMYSVWAYRPVSYNPNQDLFEELQDPELAGNANDYRFNPIKDLENQYRKRYVRSFTTNGSVEWDITKEIKLKTMVGYSINSTKSESFNNSQTRYGNKTRAEGINGSVGNTEAGNWMNDNTLTYVKTFNKKHNLNALAGISLQSSYSEIRSFSAKLIPADFEKFGINSLNEGTPNVIQAALEENTLFSYLGRVNYNYDRRYYLTASFRADGSSKFAPKNRWGYFPSASAAWTLSEEPFMKPIKSVVDNLKVRASWGLTGNNRVGSYDYLAQLATDVASNYSFDNITAYRAMIISSLGNPDLKWETTEQTNIGLDLGFLESRISFSADIYRKTTRDLLLNSDLAASTGFSKVYKNIGKMQNQGLELTLSADVIKNKKFVWNSSINIGFNQGKILALTEGQEAMTSPIKGGISSGLDNVPLFISKVGQPIGLMYGYIYEGTYKYDDFDLVGTTYILKDGVPANGMGRATIKPGDEKYRDINGDGRISAEDRTIIGRGHPLNTGGWSNNFTYAGFDLNLFFQWSYGNDIYNGNRQFMEGTTGADINQFASMVDRWTPSNPTSNIPRVKGSRPDAYTSRVVEDGSFLRLKTIQLGYTIPKSLMKKFAIQNIRAFASAQNIFTLTNYSGSDPEVSVRHSAMTPGVDYSAYPRALTLTFGLNVNF